MLDNAVLVNIQILRYFAKSHLRSSFCIKALHLVRSDSNFAGCKKPSDGRNHHKTIHELSWFLFLLLIKVDRKWYLRLSTLSSRHRSKTMYRWVSSVKLIFSWESDQQTLIIPLEWDNSYKNSQSWPHKRTYHATSGRVLPHWPARLSGHGVSEYVCNFQTADKQDNYLDF